MFFDARMKNIRCVARSKEKSGASISVHLNARGTAPGNDEAYRDGSLRVNAARFLRCRSVQLRPLRARLRAAFDPLAQVSV